MGTKGFVRLINILVFVLSVSLTAIFVSLLINVKKDLDYLVQNQLELLVNINDMYAQGLQTGQAIRNIFINPDDQIAKRNYANANKKFSEALDRAKALATQDLKEQLDKIESLWTQNSQMKAEILGLIEQGKREEVAQKIVEETKTWREIRSILLRLIEHERKEFYIVKRSIESKTKVYFVIFISILVIGAFSIIVPLILSYREMAYFLSLFEKTKKSYAEGKEHESGSLYDQIP